MSAIRSQPREWRDLGTVGLRRRGSEILRSCMTEKGISDLMAIAGRTNRTKFRDQVLKPLLEVGWLEMTIPDKPRSSKRNIANR